MDGYFQRVHHLPADVVRIIFSYNNHSMDLIKQHRRLVPTDTTVCPYNMAFYRNWFYLINTMDDEGQIHRHDGRNGTIIVYYL